jgi:hypothetical protein
MVTIITDGISDEQKATATFQSAYQDMLCQLTAPGFASVLCAHEAAHVVYFTMAGMQNYDTSPARIEYNPQLDDYVGSLASIQVLDIPKFIEGQFWEQFFKIARAHAAGGVVARKLMPSTDGGDQDDKERFEHLCAKLSADPNFSINIQDFWKKAQQSVIQDLENAEWLALIQNQAAELRSKFGL